MGDWQSAGTRKLGAALDLTVENSGLPLLPAAYADYAEGLYYIEQVPNPERASSSLRKALDADPQGPLPMLALAGAEVLRFRHAADPAAFDRAALWMERAASKAPDSAYVHLVRATLLESAQRLEPAEKAYRRVLAIHPRNGPALRGLAFLLADRNRSQEALKSYEAAVQAEPDYFQPVLDLGVFYYFRGRYVEAEREFRRVTRLAEGLAQGHHNLAAVLTDTGRYEEAEREFQQALRLERTSDTLAGMGALLAYLGRHRESAYYYEQAVALGPEDYLMISKLADAYRRTGRVAEAGRTYGQALDAAERQVARNQRDAFARAFVAYAQARLGRDSAASAQIQGALREAPQDGKILRRAVLLYQALGRSEEALRLLERVPAAVLDELSRHPDLADFRRDSRFDALKAKKTNSDGG
ncbi:MAG: tetratricopeptide repeat protein [Bryobacteraceae bacterium]|nr:tetratricopeptide repeat protein [Bryobacteraceae bacterium]